MTIFILWIIWTLFIILWVGLIVGIVKNFDVLKQMYLWEKQITQRKKYK